MTPSAARAGALRRHEAAFNQQQLTAREQQRSCPLTTRDEKGLQAVEELQSSGLSSVIFHRLDVDDITQLAEFVHARIQLVTVWFLQVNNAGVPGTTIDPKRLIELQKQDPKIEDITCIISSKKLKR